MFDRAEALAHGELDVLDRDIVLEVHEGLCAFSGAGMAQRQEAPAIALRQSGRRMDRFDAAAYGGAGRRFAGGLAIGERLSQTPDAPAGTR